jgi:hypothetical protein
MKENVWKPKQTGKKPKNRMASGRGLADGTNGATMGEKKAEGEGSLDMQQLRTDLTLQTVFLFVPLAHTTHGGETNILASDPGNILGSVD